MPLWTLGFEGVAHGVGAFACPTDERAGAWGGRCREALSRFPGGCMDSDTARDGCRCPRSPAPPPYHNSLTSVESSHHPPTDEACPLVASSDVAGAYSARYSARQSSRTGRTGQYMRYAPCRAIRHAPPYPSPVGAIACSRVFFVRCSLPPCACFPVCVCARRGSALVLWYGCPRSACLQRCVALERGVV